MAQLRVWHRLSALLIGVFLLTHMANHLAGLAGQDVHVRFMHAVRTIYRVPLAESILILALLWQISSGLVLLRRRLAVMDGPVARLQVATGAYLAFFLVVHVGAVLAGRYQGLDTDFRFAAAGFHVPYWPAFFAPYYALAVMALFTHVGCAVYWHSEWLPRYRNWLFVMFAAVGAVVGVAIVLAMAGALYDVDIPEVYRSGF